MNVKETADHAVEEKSKHKPTKNWLINILIVVVIVIFLYLFLSQFLADTTVTAQKVGSRNNVHDINLAQHNFAAHHDVRFAAPTVFNEDGLPVHGWFTQLLRLLDNPVPYENMDFSLPWNHPDNQEFSRIPLAVALSPGLNKKQNADGYPLLHYTLNTRLFPNNESLSEDYVSRADGLGNTILIGEIQEGLPAWAEPGSARDPAMGLSPGPNTMGVNVWNGATIIGFADGRAITIDNDIDPAVLKALSTPDGGEILPENY